MCLEDCPDSGLNQSGYAYDVSSILTERKFIAVEWSAEERPTNLMI